MLGVPRLNCRGQFEKHGGEIAAASARGKLGHRKRAARMPAVKVAPVACVGQKVTGAEIGYY